MCPGDSHSFAPALFCSTIYSLQTPALFFCLMAKKSGRQDLNLRPLDPQSSALARLRYAPISALA